MIRALCLTWLIAALAPGQTVPVAVSTPPAIPGLATATLPAYIMVGGSYNQLAGAAGFVAGFIPEVQSVGLYGSVTADLVPIKTTVGGKSVYLISGSIRAGEHKTLYRGVNNALLIGGDAGASFNSGSGSPPASLSVGLAGSFTITYVHQFSAHWAAALPIRMLYMSGVGPNGTGAWNPVVEFGVVWKP